MFKYGVACSLNDVSTTAPIVLRGPIEQLCREAHEIGYDGLEIACHTHLDAHRFLEDAAYEKGIRDALEMIDVRLVEHVIVADNDYISMWESGMMGP